MMRATCSLISFIDSAPRQGEFHGIFLGEISLIYRNDSRMASQKIRTASK
jgi:hypothetical protein